MNALSRKPIYLFFFALFPVISLLSANINELTHISGLRAAVLVLALAGGLLLILGGFSREWHRAALLLSITFLGVLSYGYLNRLLLTRLRIDNSDPVYTISSALTLAGIIVGDIFVWFKLKNPTRLAQNLNIISFVMLLLPAFILTSVFFDRRKENDSVPGDLTIPEAAFTTSARPDIYYIVLDGYARADVLAALFDYDNDPFIEALRSRGFFVAANSHTNYVNTVASLASSLNMQYLEEPPSTETNSSNLPNLRGMVQNNEVVYILNQLGYETITIASGYSNTEVRFADHFLSTSFRGVNGFETLLLQYMLFGRFVVQPGYLFEDGLQYAPHRERVRFAIETLAETVPEMDSPKFVFAHIVSPHPPFVFGAKGEEIQPNYPYFIGDGSDYKGSKSEYIRGYRDQVNYLNEMILESVDGILARSPSRPVIIIQSDHGSGAYLDWESVEANTCLKERAANFTAVLTPDERVEFYDTITPVNIFRLIFNGYLNMDFELLADKSYFVHWGILRGFVDISSQVESSDACLTE